MKTGKVEKALVRAIDDRGVPRIYVDHIQILKTPYDVRLKVYTIDDPVAGSLEITARQAATLIFNTKHAEWMGGKLKPKQEKKSRGRTRKVKTP